MERHVERDLEILTAISEGTPVTQRALAERLGVALGLTNLYLKRLATKGFIKITDFPRKPAARKRLRYMLTPRGVAEKTRLTYEYMGHSLNLYRRTRQTLRDALGHLAGAGLKRIALYGRGEPVELAYLTLKELGLEPTGVFHKDAGGSFLGFPVQDVRVLLEQEFDGLVLATFDLPDGLMAELAALGLPADRFLTLRRPGVARARGEPR